jgi:hypothetical protein
VNGFHRSPLAMWPVVLRCVTRSDLEPADACPARGALRKGVGEFVAVLAVGDGDGKRAGKAKQFTGS